ncbi:hypothetical protein Q3G72_017281 [Acer saccharum]|nr:hypothetical protein Q3G72_017281 [Acer saccharum]
MLNLAENNLDGSIPSFLSNLNELTCLALGYNLFKPSPLPSSFENLSKLEILFVANASLVGEIPNSIGKLVSLPILDLSTNYLSSKIPYTIAELKSIMQIELSDNQLSGELPESLVNLTTLLNFDVSQNNLTGKSRNHTSSEFHTSPHLWQHYRSNSISSMQFASLLSEILGRIRHGNIVKLLLCVSGVEFSILVFEYVDNVSARREWWHRFTGLANSADDSTWCCLSKRPNDTCFGENKDIVKWVTESALSSPERKTTENASSCCRDLRKLVDPRMQLSTGDYEEIDKVLDVAVLCTTSFPINRPFMRRVVELLKVKIHKLALPN